MNCIFNQINGAFHNYLSSYTCDNDDNTTFVVSYYLFVALVVTFAPLLLSGANVTTRANVMLLPYYDYTNRFRVSTVQYRPRLGSGAVPSLACFLQNTLST